MSGLQTDRDRDPTALGRNCVAVTLGTDIPDDTKSVFLDGDGTCTVAGVSSAPITLFGVSAYVPLPFVPLKISVVSAGQTIYRTF